MGEEKLASFFLKVQAVEESFLLLEVKERSRALNILQSSVNKLLNFVGDADICSASSCATDTSLSNQENSPNGGSRNKNLKRPAAHGKKTQRNRTKNKTRKRTESGTFCNNEETERKLPPENFINTDAANDTPLQQQPENGKSEDKGNFDDDLQELADFDCSTYVFNPAMQQHTSDNAVSGAGASHMTQCNGKFADKMLSMSVATSGGNICPTSVTQSQYQDQIIEASVSHEGDGCVISHCHYGDQILSGSQDMKHNCHLAHAAQFRASQIMSTSEIDSSAEASQYVGAAIDSNGDPSQYPGEVIDSTGGPSRFAGGVIDSSGDPPQYAGRVIDGSGEGSQYAGAVIDSAGDSSQYAGGVVDMTVGQDAQNCNPSHGHAQYTAAMIPTAQDVTVCTTSQYAGTVLAMSVPETISYSAAHYSHTIMQGVNCAVTGHPQFTADAVLDMSTAATRHCVDTTNGLPASQHNPPLLPPSQYAGTIFEGTVVGAPVSACSPFQLRRAPVFEPHEAFHRSQEFTQSLVHASMLQQQQLYQQLHHQVAVVGSSARRRAFVCRGCGKTLTHHRSVKAHLASHGSSPLSCRFCQQRHVNHVAFIHHLCGGQQWRQSANVSREIHMCHECGKFFTSRLKLKGHCEGEHGIDMPREVKFTCRFCGLQLPKKVTLFLHYRQHACGRFVCLQCGAILNDFMQYASHMACHERRKKKRTCQQCGQLFHNHQNFVEHIKTHAGHTCETCQKTYSSFVALSKHKAKAHHVKTKTKAASSIIQSEHHCDQCNKQFPRAKDLEQHIYLHTSEKPLHCGVCNMSVRTPKALAKHQQTIGHCRRSGKSRENQHLCSQCGKAYFRRQALQRHLRQHQSSKAFSCKYCNFTCNERDNLRCHSARHFSTQRNFICELCGAAFHAKKTLEMHHSYKHNSERRFKCPDCPMTFKARNALGRHSKTHSRARDHGCWCGAAFNRLYNLRRHMRLVHGSDDALPPLRKVEVLDSNQSVKQALSTPPAKKMLVKTRKVKADCMQKEQEAAAAAVVIGGEEEEEGGGGGDSHGCVDGRAREGVQTLLPHQVGMTVLASQDGLENVSNVDGYSSMATVGVGVVGQANVLHPFSHHVHAPPHHHPHPHLTMEQSYAMVSATLHHHHHNLHNLHHHDPQQQTLIATATTAAATDHPATATTTPFPNTHPAIDYSQLPNLSAIVPYPANIIPSSTTSNTNSDTANATSVTADTSAQQRQDYYPPPPSGAASMVEGMQQQTAEYTTSPFSFIQNFLLPSVGVANLLDLAHASGSK